VISAARRLAYGCFEPPLNPALGCVVRCMRQLRVTTRSHLLSVASFSASGQFRAPLTFSNVNHAAVELRAVLPLVLLPKLDFSTLQVRPLSFVDGSLRQVHSDLLYSVQLFRTRLTSTCFSSIRALPTPRCRFACSKRGRRVDPRPSSDLAE